MHTITIQQFEEFIENQEQTKVNILDLRTPDAFNQAHIAGAKNIPLDQLTKKIQELDKTKQYYLICYSGNFSAMGTQYLTQNGYQAVNVQSGMNGYSGPVVSSER